MRRTWAAAIVAGVTLWAAPAAVAGPPTALGTDSNGFTFVGDADSGRIDVLNPSDGSVQRSFGAFGANDGQIGPVGAIDLAPDNTVWILEATGPTPRLLQYSNGGSQLRSIPLPGCSTGIAPAPITRGGLDVTTTDAWVAHPCQNATLRIPLATGVAQTGPSVANAKGVAVSADGSRVAFGRAGTNEVRQFPTSAPYNQIGDGTPPFYPDTETVDVRDVFLDGSRVLITADAAQNKIRMVSEFGTADNASEFRWIGGPGADVGRVSQPVAIDVFGQYGGSLAGNVFVADYGNNRVQRLDAGGYAYWASVRPTSGPVVPVPVNTAAPTLTGTAQVGQTLTCNAGSWTGSPQFTYVFTRDGAQVGTFSTTATRTLTAQDSGRQVACTVRGTNSSGSADASSQAVTVQDAPPTTSAPQNTAPPTISGTAQVGQTLTCVDGTWTGQPSPTFTYSWRRNGTEVATTKSYTVAAGDVGQQLTCRVTGTNSVGSATATSGAVTGASAGGGRVGVSINAGAAAVNTRTVSLRIRQPAGATSVLISNDGGFSAPAIRPIEATQAYGWTLATSGSERLPKVVYVRFVGPGLDEDQTYSDDIVLDQAAPTISSARLTSQKLSVRAKDKQTGVRFLQYAKKTKGSYKQVRYRKVTKLARKRVGSARYVRVLDGAGNRSKWKKVRR